MIRFANKFKGRNLLNEAKKKEIKGKMFIILTEYSTFLSYQMIYLE